MMLVIARVKNEVSIKTEYFQNHSPKIKITELTKKSDPIGRSLVIHRVTART